MLFLAISTPAPTRPTTVTAARKKFWAWIAPQLKSGAAKSVYARPGRGAVVVFDVPDNETLHARLNEWADMIPATFEILPLIDPQAAQGYLKKQGK
jgi:muconolactone delta-isomerase